MKDNPENRALQDQLEKESVEQEKLAKKLLKKKKMDRRLSDRSTSRLSTDNGDSDPGGGQRVPDNIANDNDCRAAVDAMRELTAQAEVLSQIQTSATRNNNESHTTRHSEPISEASG